MAGNGNKLGLLSLIVNIFPGVVQLRRRDVDKNGEIRRGRKMVSICDGRS